MAITNRTGQVMCVCVCGRVGGQAGMRACMSLLGTLLMAAMTTHIVYTHSVG